MDIRWLTDLIAQENGHPTEPITECFVTLRIGVVWLSGQPNTPRRCVICGRQFVNGDLWVSVSVREYGYENRICAGIHEACYHQAPIQVHLN